MVSAPQTSILTLPKASGIIVNDLMYKHWDEWVETIPHPFVADFDGNMMGTATDIMEGRAV